MTDDRITPEELDAAEANARYLESETWIFPMANGGISSYITLNAILNTYPRLIAEVRRLHSALDWKDGAQTTHYCEACEASGRKLAAAQSEIADLKHRLMNKGGNT